MAALTIAIEIDAREFASACERMNDYFEDCPEVLRREIQDRFKYASPLMSTLEAPSQTGSGWKMKPSRIFLDLLGRARAYAGGWEGDETERDNEPEMA